MFGLPLAFAAPGILAALALLPVLYYLLRLTPPPPKRVPLPTLPIVKDLIPDEETPARTPWWLLAIRLLLAALVILAMAGPVWNPRSAGRSGTGPQLLIIDNGWAAAPDWDLRLARALALAQAAQSAGRPFGFRALADQPSEIIFGTGAEAIERLRALQPMPHTLDRLPHLESIRSLAARSPGLAVDWIADGVALAGQPDFAAPLSAAVSAATVHSQERSGIHALAGAQNLPDGLVARVLRADTQAKDSGVARASDSKGRPLAEARYQFGAGQTEAQAKFDLPLELRNEVSRIDVAGTGSAGAVTLLDAQDRRRRVGLVSGETVDTAQPLLSAVYYVTKALAPYADLRVPPRGAASGLERVIEDGATVIVLTDIGTLTGAALDLARRFVEDGGVLVRFASTQATAPADDLVPVRLRRSGRTLGSMLSWEKPQKLAPFSENSPFAGLAAAPDVTVLRQLLAEPEPALAQKTWAQLQDGTPLVTGATRGKGLLALVHVPPDAQWSTLPLSGLFVDMLRKLVGMSSAGPEADEGNDKSGPRAAPARLLDGRGAFGPPPVTAKPIAASRRLPATHEHPPGFYGPPEAAVAVNTLAASASLSPVNLAGFGHAPLVDAAPLDLRPWLIGAALALFFVDAIATLLLSGALGRIRPRRAAAAAAAGFALGLAVLAAPDRVLAQDARNMRPEDIQAALKTRLAYVITGDREADEASKLGLEGISRALQQRTAFEPGAPMGVDLATDELVFYPLIYWPMTPNRPMPPAASIRKIDSYMRNGGIVLFDTRDAFAARPGRAPTPETRRLREILASIDVPELEPVRKEHVVTKTFFLLEGFMGRYNSGESWIEALPPDGKSQKERPAQGGDRVSPIIITSNDLAAAWAVDRTGLPRYPMVAEIPNQRELSIRGGINIMMYAMTGNYKSDQVHVPALLERLGQ